MEKQRLKNCYETDEEAPQTNRIIIHTVPSPTSRWTHIEDLDQFFSQMYNYWKGRGLTCLVLTESTQLFQFLYIIVIGSYVTQCINFYDLWNSETNLEIHDVFLSPGECVEGFSLLVWLILTFGIFVWIFQAVKVALHVKSYFTIKAFYREALHVPDDELQNSKWQGVEKNILAAQKAHEMCVHKKELNHLDVYQRILRFENYFVGMVNKKIIPVKLTVPFAGEIVMFPHSFKKILEIIFFWGPWGIFKNNWHLKDEYKKASLKIQLTNHVSRCLIYASILTLLLCPLIFIYQFFYSFFSYADKIKREPSSLGMRRWSLYGRLYLRHFNELEHELDARLSRAYRPAVKYMESFQTPTVTVICRFLVFVVGAPLAVLIVLTLVNSRITTSWEHTFAAMAGFGVIVTACRAMIPEENVVFCPEKLLMAVLTQAHYLPDSWRGQAHTTTVRDEFSQLFQYRIVYLIEEILSPLTTPYLLFRTSYKASEIVDFFRNFTVEVAGVGDVCSFAVLDVAKHGNSDWQDTEKFSDTPKDNYQPANDGKTEMSLLRFATTHPDWTGPEESRDYVNAVRNKVDKELETMSYVREEIANPSLYDSSILGGYGYSTEGQSLLRTQFPQTSNFCSWRNNEEMRSPSNLSSYTSPPYESLRRSWHASLMRTENYKAIREAPPELMDNETRLVNLGSLIVHEIHLKKMDSKAMASSVSSPTDPFEQDHSETTPLLLDRNLAKSS